VGHPYSALNLRLALAGFGLVTCVILAAILWRYDATLAAAVAGAAALIALIDMVVIQERRRQRRREEGRGQSLFE
jgi:uncharacterized membrane protein YqjE